MASGIRLTVVDRPICESSRTHTIDLIAHHSNAHHRYRCRPRFAKRSWNIDASRGRRRSGLQRHQKLRFEFSFKGIEVAILPVVRATGLDEVMPQMLLDRILDANAHRRPTDKGQQEPDHDLVVHSGQNLARILAGTITQLKPSSSHAFSVAGF